MVCVFHTHTVNPTQSAMVRLFMLYTITLTQVLYTLALALMTVNRIQHS